LEFSLLLQPTGTASQLILRGGGEDKRRENEEKAEVDCWIPGQGRRLP